MKANFNIIRTLDHERRRYKRLQLNDFMEIQGTNIHGDNINEDVFTFNISRSGAYFPSRVEYNDRMILKIIIHLTLPLDEEAPAGIWEVEARIVRIDHVIRSMNETFQKCHIAVNFVNPLGSNPTLDNWKQIID